jgi:hypothetical protein
VCTQEGRSFKHAYYKYTYREYGLTMYQALGSIPDNKQTNKQTKKQTANKEKPT